MGTKGELYFPINTTIVDPYQKTAYTIKKIIGRGAYAQCFLATVNSNESYAMKVIKLSDIKSSKVQQKLQSEITIHSSLNHPNIVKMYTSFRNQEYVFMILELCERGSLDELLKRNGKLKEKYVSKFVNQVVKALIYLHGEMSVVHRDLKLGNLFLDSDLNIKVGDFGLCAEIKNGQKRKTVCGTPNYIAPEVLFGKESGHSFEADVWSLGVIIYTLLIGTPPFQMKKVEDIYKQIEKTNFVFPEDNTLSNDAIDLINKILTNNPEERLDLDQIMNHRFLTQKENLTFRMYKNLISRNFSLGPISDAYVVYSMPSSFLKGIGYVLSTGVCGVYYQDLSNVYLKNDSLVLVKMMQESNKKVFVTEEYHLADLPNNMNIHLSNINYFIQNFVLPTYKYKICKTTTSNVFVAKIKKISNGLLFVMTNFVFIFDFNDGTKVAVANEGANVYCFNDDGPILFGSSLFKTITEILKGFSLSEK